MMRTSRLIAACCALVVLLLAGCDGTASNTGGSTTGGYAPLPTFTPLPVAPTPTNVPPGWTAYAGVYLSFAYPPGWSVSPNDNNPGPHPTPGAIDKEYILTPNGGSHEILIGEADHLDAATLQLNCGGSRRYVTVAGLTMQDDSQPSNGHYDYSLYTPQGVGYGLAAYIYPNDQASQTLMMQIFNTFRPVYTTSACK